MSAPAPAKRGPTAYFLFADAVRDAVRADLQGGDPAAKVSVAAVAKGVGERWKALTEEDKAVYKARAAERAEARRAAAAADAEAAGGEEAGEEGGDAAAAPAPAPPPPAGSSLPLSVVRRIMLVDPEVKRVSAGAARAAAAAVEGALASLAAAAAGVAAQAKRRTLRPADVLAAVRRDGRWADAGCVAALAGSVKEAGGGGGGGRGGPARKRSATPASPRAAKGKRPAAGPPQAAAAAAAFFAPRGGARAG